MEVGIINGMTPGHPVNPPLKQTELMNEGIKKWTVSLLLMLMLLQSNQIVAVYFHFLLHRAEVIALFCAPRHSDESTCNG